MSQPILILNLAIKGIVFILDLHLYIKSVIRQSLTRKSLSPCVLCLINNGGYFVAKSLNKQSSARLSPACHSPHS